MMIFRIVTQFFLICGYKDRNLVDLRDAPVHYAPVMVFRGFPEILSVLVPAHGYPATILSRVSGDMKRN